MNEQLKGLAVGRMVHFVTPTRSIRPAIVVRVWNDETGCSNLQVFTDGKNDMHWTGDGANVLWKTSICFDAEKKPQTWHWPTRA